MKHGKNGPELIRFYDINTFTKAGRDKVTAYTLDTFDYNILNPDLYVKSKNKCYAEQFAAFDIETYSVRCESPYAYMYIWQMCVDGEVCFGRTWEEFNLFMGKIADHLRLSSNKRMVIYVHNLSYEFQFLKTLLNWQEVFARGPHKIMYARTECFEFRCGYFLSNESLEKFCEHEDTYYRKVKNEIIDENEGVSFDYDIERTPFTELTNDELAYCYNDVAGLWEAVQSRLQEDTLCTIPLTSTGYVRRDCRNALKKRKGYRDYLRQTALTKELYQMCTEAFRGGDTHAMYHYSGQILEDIESWDFSSSYPYNMMCCKFPMSPFIKVKADKIIEYIKKGYAALFSIRIFNFEIKDDFLMPYLPVAKCRNRKGIETDNGRILSGEMVEITVTDIDYRIIIEQYDFEQIQVSDCYISKYDYLPIELRQVTLDYFTGKTSLKGFKDKAYEYMKSKNKLNAIYGMSVTAIIQDEYVFENGMFHVKHPDPEEALNRHYLSPKLFIAYQWGLWVTAWARWRLNELRNIFGDDAVYNDTDSVKGFEGHWTEINCYNIRTLMHIKKLDLIPRAKNKKGEWVYMGVADYEGTYDKFITWGSKKYAVIKDGEIEITVAGLSKSKGKEELEKTGFESFKPGWTVEESGNLTAYYDDSPPHYIELEGTNVLTASSVALFKTGYTLDITGEYLELIKNNYF